ncbi:hypothetical protein M422DRAFT_785374 [Sphaerobolus stellatus SS14]|uniref:Tyr recombinase domain-containing protein n=1 Tax=Sphaerobolus stellatus (strain SS14) TaxID=990650 RepID=A0A0C9UA71_SPHS4|nr:hypothetical protein M422DRAFT_785374 [Sphaerobolus stellatus SS14]
MGQKLKATTQPTRCSTREKKRKAPSPPSDDGSSSAEDIRPVKKLMKKKKARQDDNANASNTSVAYRKQLAFGKDWLQELVDAERKFKCPPGCPEELGVSEDWTLEELEGAFSPIPNRVSARILALFIYHRCFEIGRQNGIAWQTKSAFQKLWADSDPNGRYVGPWVWHVEGNYGTGNPANSREVEQVVKAVQNRDAETGERKHSAAMKKEYMDRILDWSERECPEDLIQQVHNGEERSFAARAKVTQHLCMRAFSASAFTLWTRNSELAALKRKHYRQDLRTSDARQLLYDECTLENRKGWQKKVQSFDDLARGQRYQVYPQPEHASLDMYTHMRRWLTFLDRHVYSEETRNENNLIFPSVSNNGLLHPENPITSQTVQKWLDEFLAGAGIDVGNLTFTTHTFRRGGAQYRYIFSPPGKRWNLKTCRWWGGWAEGEHKNTMVKYLLDEQYHYEEDCGNALCPLPPTQQDFPQTSPSFDDVRTIVRHEIRQEFRVLGKELAKELVEATASIHRLVVSSKVPEEAPPRTGEDSIGSNGNTSTSPPSLESGPLPKSEDTLPPGLCIPSLPKRALNGRPVWMFVIDDWYRSDPQRNPIALKDWKHSWITGENRETLGVPYGHRRRIVEEYERCNSDAELFTKTWPEAKRGFTALYLAIRNRRKDTGETRGRKVKKMGATGESKGHKKKKRA